MTFLNGIMLLGLAAVAIPVIIHILNRRRAQVVDWGAMQFLAESLASRSRRILLEDILLMLLRCLVLALLAFALARPFLKTGRLLAGAADDAQDVAIVLDGSLSMTLDPDGKSNFQRALDEAHQVVQACRSGDAVSVILAGPTAQPVVASPVSDRQDVHDALDELTAPGGSMGVLEGLHAATLSLAAGANPAKKVVLITDAQALGWDLSARQRWQFLSEATGSLATPPTVIVRALEAPREWANACAAALSFSRAIIGTDRPVKVTATVANTGTGTIAPEAVELRVDGALVDSRKIAPVAAGASSSAIFEPRFELPGPHVVSMRVVGEDDLPGDNETARVVDVLRTLPVLILQGTSSPTPLKSDGDFLKVAMVPPPGEQTPGEAPEHLIRPTVVAAADVGAVKDFSAYKVVVLANVPRLPSAVAGRLARFVADGGGLLVAPGGKADKGFYNDWSTPDGKGLLGCRLVEIREDAAGPDADEASARIAVNTLDHPAMRLLSDPAGSDLSAVRIRRHWVLAADAGDESVGIGPAKARARLRADAGAADGRGVLRPAAEPLRVLSGDGARAGVLPGRAVAAPDEPAAGPAVRLRGPRPGPQRGRGRGDRARRAADAGQAPAAPAAMGGHVRPDRAPGPVPAGASGRGPGRAVDAPGGRRRGRALPRGALPGPGRSRGEHA